MIRCPVWFGDDDLLEQEDQRQAPVAAEKQRSATHRCVFPDAGVRSDRMRQLLSGAIPCDDSIEDGDQVNEMAIQCCRRDASAVLCVLPKTKRNDLWELKPHGRNESASPTWSKCALHRYCAASTKLASLKISVHARVPRTSILFCPSRTERFSFHYRFIGRLEFSHDLTRQFRIG